MNQFKIQFNQKSHFGRSELRLGIQDLHLMSKENHH